MRRKRNDMQATQMEIQCQCGQFMARLKAFPGGTPPAGTPDKFNLKAMWSVMPFIVKGKLFRKARPSPFFEADGATPVVVPYVLSADERRALRPPPRGGAGA
jgi:hypothetical protein